MTVKFEIFSFNKLPEYKEMTELVFLDRFEGHLSEKGRSKVFFESDNKKKYVCILETDLPEFVNATNRTVLGRFKNYWELLTIVPRLCEVYGMGFDGFVV